MKDARDDFDRAVEALRGEGGEGGPPDEVLAATLSRLEQAGGAGERSVGAGGGVVRLLSLFTARVAAAAVILMLIGYAVGRVTAGGPEVAELAVEVERSLRPGLEAQIREKVLAEMQDGWRVDLAGVYLQLKGELSDEFRAEIGRSSLRTVSASSTVTHELLEDLIEAINTAQVEDRRWVTSAIEQIESNRLEDRTQLATGIERLAVLTDDKFSRTRNDMVRWLSDVKGPVLAPLDSGERNEIEERGTE